MATSSPVSPSGPDTSHSSGTASRCQVCGTFGPVVQVGYRRNVGMLIIRRTYKLNANLCKKCLDHQFWDFTWKNLLLGPWGIISLIMTPIYLITNIVSYVGAKKKLDALSA